MSGKSIALSVRVSEEDADFLARLKIEGAATLSEKLRAIVAQARLHEEGTQDYATCFSLMQQTLSPAVQRIREAELQRKTHSELVQQLLDWLPEMAAYVLTHQPTERRPGGLEEIEAGMADRVFRLMEAVLRMGVTQQAPCYDKRAIARRIGPVLELGRVIASTQTVQEENLR